MNRTGMVVSLGGVMRRCADIVERRDGKSLAVALRQLHDHLEEFRQRHKAGDKTVADEFFELYVE